MASPITALQERAQITTPLRKGHLRHHSTAHPGTGSKPSCSVQNHRVTVALQEASIGEATAHAAQQDPAHIQDHVLSRLLDGKRTKGGVIHLGHCENSSSVAYTPTAT